MTISRNQSLPFGADPPSFNASDGLRGIGRITQAKVDAAIKAGIGRRRLRCDGTVHVSLADGAACDPLGIPVNAIRSDGRTYELPGQLGIGGAGGSGSLSINIPGTRAGHSWYAGTTEDTSGVLGFYSGGTGLLWSGRPSVPGAGGTVYAFAFVPAGVSNSEALYAAVGTSGVYKSLNRGITWTQSTTGFGGADVRCIAANANGTVILAGTVASGLFRSVNGGAAWTRDTVVGGGFNPTAQIFSVAYLRNGIALVSTDSQFDLDRNRFGGLFRLSGAAWVQLTFPGTSPIVGIQAWGIDRASGGFSAGAWAALTGIGDGYAPFYRTTDSGITFSPVYDIWGDDSTRSIMAVAPDLVSPRAAISAALSSVIYAAGNSSVAFTDGVIKTTNGGTTWELCLELLNVMALAVDQREHETVLAGCQPGGPSAGGIFATHDAGTTWDDVSEGLDASHGGTTVNALLIG